MGIQFLKYALVGLVSNATAYILYLWLAGTWLPPVGAMSLLYAVVVAIGYFGNRGLTFRYDGGLLSSGGRYLLCYSIGYFINLGALWVLSGVFGFPHQLVQLFTLIVVAGLMYLMQKTFVFRVEV